MFIPLTECAYVLDTMSMRAHFSASYPANLTNKRNVAILPPSMTVDLAIGSNKIRSSKFVTLSTKTLKLDPDHDALALLNAIIREDVVYISGAKTLWYLKGVVNGAERLLRSPLTLTLMAMHRLSELCRYNPLDWQSLLDGQRNWLISEFVNQAPQQYMDGIASEITGFSFMQPNARLSV